MPSKFKEIHNTFGKSGETTTCNGNLTITGDFTANGAFTFGDAVADSLILKGRVSTGSTAGAALAIDATTYQYGEGLELRYNVSDWADTYTLTTFNALYLRAETNEANASGNIRGAEIYGVTNNVNLGSLWGALVYAYIKGTSAKTVGPAYGIQAELSFDAGSSTNTITTEASAGFFRITGGVCDAYTKLHGVILRAGDMDGASRTYGDGILIEDGPEAGAITWTNGIHINQACTTGLRITGNTTNGILIAGTQTSAIVINGAGTNLLEFDAVEGAVSGSPGTLTPTEKIAVKVGSNTRYIHCGTVA